MNSNQTGLYRSCEQRRSAGKIVKNSKYKSIINYTSETSAIQKKGKTIDKSSSNKKHPKVFIKLETQNLSKYLGDSISKRESSPNKLMKIDEYEKVCPTKRSPPT